MKAYSYIRFSSQLQEKGHSLARQTKLAEEWCLANHIELSNESFQDLGISAYRGSNFKDGALGLFLESVKNGLISSDSFLLVEALDRLSRDKILSALNRFQEILETGITIVTLQDNKKWDKNSLNDLMNIMYSIMLMAKANSESEVKSQRIKAVKDHRKEFVRKNGGILTKSVKGWMVVDNGTIKLIPERVAIVKKIFELLETGLGVSKVCQYLNDNKIPTFTGVKYWQRSMVINITWTKAVCGWLDDIPNYYPVVITEEHYNRVKAIMAARSRKGGRADGKINVLKNLVKCNKCGTSLYRKNIRGYQYFICQGKEYGVGSSLCTGYVREDWLESEVIKMVSELDLSLLTDNKPDVNTIISGKQYEKTTVQKKINTLLEMVEIDGNIVSIVNKIKEYEAILQTIENDIASLSIVKVSAKDNIDKLALLDINNSDHRLRLNQLLKNLVSGVFVTIKTKNVRVMYHEVEFNVKKVVSIGGRSVEFNEDGENFL